MNERYSFRGKYSGKIRDFVGKFVYGDLISIFGMSYIHPQNNATEVNDYDLTKLLALHPIDAVTIGQCTGLRDKRGRLIFEGDIVITSKGGNRVLVAWNAEKLCFEGTRDSVLYYVKPGCEVIGNIHDNPELLEQ